MGALHSEPRKLRSLFTGGVIEVACVTQPSGPRESIECVRYSPTAASTPWMTPGDSSKTAPPLGTFQPADVLPQRTSARAGVARAAKAPAAQSPAQSPTHDGRNRKARWRMRTSSARAVCKWRAEARAPDHAAPRRHVGAERSWIARSVARRPELLAQRVRAGDAASRQGSAI